MGGLMVENNNLDTNSLSSEDIKNSCAAGLKYFIDRKSLFEAIARLEREASDMRAEIKTIAAANSEKEIERIYTRLSSIENEIKIFQSIVDRVDAYGKRLDILEKNDRNMLATTTKNAAKVVILTSIGLLFVGGAVTLVFKVIGANTGGG